MSDVTRAKLDGETDGLIMVLVDADTDRFLGAATLGITGDEIVQIVSALMHADAPCHVLAEMLPIHPTVAEFFPTILRGLEPVASVMRPALTDTIISRSSSEPYWVAIATSAASRP